MRKSFLLILLVCASALGCAHTHRRNQQPPEKYYEEINRAAQDRTSRIILQNEERHLGNEVKVAIDSTSWTEASTGSRRITATAQIREIQMVNRGKGAWEGFRTGFLVSFIPMGLCTGYLAQELCEDECDGEFAQGFLAGGFLGGGSVGLLLGAPIGAAIGNKDKYVLSSISSK
jgi:hypothetical protein